MTTKDMTTGNPTKLILWFMVPLLIGNIFQQLYNFADTLIVGRTLGVHALAAVGATGPLVFLALGFIIGMTAGQTTITGQRFGAKDYTGVRKSFTANILISVLFSFILTIFFSTTVEWLLKVMNTPADIIQDSFKYIFIIYIGISTIIFYNILSNTIRALGDSRSPLIFLVIASILNVTLDLVFILKLNMGISGAAWATVISQGVSAILCAMFIYWKLPLLRIKKEDWRVDIRFLWEHIRLGFPMGFQMSVLTIGLIALQMVLNSFGSTTIAGFTTAVRVEQLASQALLALGVTMATYTAQNYGAGKINRIRVGVKKAVIICLGFSIFAAILVILFGKQLVSLFVEGNHPEVVSQAQIYLNIIMVFYFALGILLLYRNVLQGMGNALLPLLSGTTELIMRAAGAFILAHYFGYVGACFATPCAWVSAAILLTIGYNRFMHKAVMRNDKHQIPLHFLNLD